MLVARVKHAVGVAPILAIACTYTACIRISS